MFSCVDPLGAVKRGRCERTANKKGKDFLLTDGSLQLETSEGKEEAVAELWSERGNGGGGGA